MKKIILTFIIPVVLLTACGGNKGGQTEQADSSQVKIEGKKDLFELNPMQASPEFPEAKVSVVSPDLSKPLKAGMTKFVFKVDGFELGAQTPGSEKIGIANSKQGQHLHVIVDNEPYMAHYKPEVEIELTEGWHTLVVFPSRSWHESVKSPGAAILKKFKVGNPPASADIDITRPMLIFSRPKGVYKGPEETTDVLVDFYLFNCDLSPGGYKVKAVINAREYTIDQWKPMLMDGLSLGDNAIALKLVDKEGNLVPGPYNDVHRDFKVHD